MRGGIPIMHGAIPRPGDLDAVTDDHGSDRHLAYRSRKPRLLEGHLHPPFILDHACAGTAAATRSPTLKESVPSSLRSTTMVSPSWKRPSRI